MVGTSLLPASKAPPSKNLNTGTWRSVQIHTVQENSVVITTEDAVLVQSVQETSSHTVTDSLSGTQEWAEFTEAVLDPQEVLSSLSWESAVSETERKSDRRLSPKEQKKFDELRIDAITCKERGKLDQYEKKLIEAMAIDPDHIEIIRMLGDYYFDTGKNIKALSLLKRVVNEDPTNHKAVWQIGQIYLYENQIETAKLLVEKAISLKDDNPKYYISLVEIDYQLGNLKDAIKSLEKVLKLRPKNIEYLLGIATLHEENSEPSKAAYYYSKIIELDPLHDIAKSKLRVLHP